MGLRIALACPYAWDSPGGVQVHIRQLAAGLRERGHATVTLAPALASSHHRDVEIVGRAARVPFNGSLAPICPDPRSRRRIRAALEAFGPDVVHAHEPFAPSTALFATLESAAPVVAVSHTYFERSVLFAAYAPVLRSVWRRPAIWLAVSGATKGFLARHLDPGTDIRVVPNGADVEMFRDARPAELPGELTAGPRLLFVSRLEPRKAFPVAVRAFSIVAREVPDAVLLVAGEGSDRSALDQLDPAARDRVLMLGTVPHDQLPSYHAAADVFLAPATGRESFGIVLVEAMASGLPVVATDIPGYREVVRDGEEGLLVPPGDPRALAQAIRRLLTDRPLAERLRQAGLRRSDRFRWTVVLPEIEAAYRDAMSRGRR